MTTQLRFPTHIMIFEVSKVIPKGSLGYWSSGVGLGLIFTAPLQMRVKDRIWFDIRNGHIEVVERGHIVIWRAAWLN